MAYILTPIHAYTDHPSAIEFASHFASEAQLDLLFYRAIHPLAYGTNMTYGSMVMAATPTPAIDQSKLYKEHEENDRALISSWKAAISNFPPSEYIIDGGTDHDLIREISSMKKIDFLLKSSNAEYSWIDKILPSETSELTSILSCPIISLPDEVEFQPLTTIVYASDLLDEDVQGLKTVNRLAHIWNARVYLIHICNNAEEKEKQESKLTMLTHELTTKKRPITITLDREHVAQPLFELASRLKANMIVTMKKNKGLIKRLFEPSITSKLQANSSIPVMILNASS